MEAYPLESLLSLRRFREESAVRRVAAAQTDCRLAEEAVKKEEEALERWRVWYAEEVSRRYEGLTSVSPRSLRKSSSAKCRSTKPESGPKPRAARSRK